MGLFKKIFCNCNVNHEIDGMKVADLEKLTEREKFSSYLPYVAYDKENQIYYNQDDTMGVIWECTPLNFANSKVENAMTGMINLNLPTNSVMQFILFADDYVDEYLKFSRDIASKRNNQILKDTFENYRRFLLVSARNGCEKNAMTPVRNFRLFFTIKVKNNELSDNQFHEILMNAKEILKTSYMNPMPLEPSYLLSLLRRLMNSKSSSHNNQLSYDLTKSISKQIIFSETDIEKTFDYLRFGDKYLKCVTPKVFPPNIDILTGANLTGGIMGKISDIDQIKTPFLFAMNIVFDKNLKKNIRRKCDIILQQQAAASFAVSLGKKKEEFLWAIEKIENGENFVYIIPIVWAWGDSIQSCNETISKIKRIWENNGFVMQIDKGILPIMFLSSLPFGTYTDNNNIEKMERHFIVPADSAAPVLPVQADFCGGGDPILSFIGRKGQFVTLDLFNKVADNYNMFVTASTGKGKSFFVNYLASRYYGAGAKIRIVDIGFSYKKLINMFNGRYIEFKPSEPVSLNPFSFIDDFDQDGPLISMIIYQMAYAGTDIIPFAEAENAMTLIREACKWAYQKHGSFADIDVVYDYLNNFPDYADEHAFNCAGKEECGLQFKVLAQTLAFRISDYASWGTYGKWFKGQSDFNMKNDDFVVIELEYLKAIPSLFKVITLMMINAITRDMYLTDRNVPKLAIFDESWQFLRNNNVIKFILEEGYRRARKYYGSFTVITQSILDLELFGDVGQVILANSAYKFFLESPDFDKAKAKGIIVYDDFTMKILKSVSSNRPNYSEIFLDTPFGLGVARLIVDPFSYYVYTSDAKDFSKVENIVQQGKTYDEAIKEIVGGFIPVEDD
ncbi:MAG: TraC family protein [Thermoplasmata archaeon]